MEPQAQPDVHVLVADPDVEARTAARRALERVGFSVTTSADGTDALGRFSPELFDVVVAAVEMPFQDGLEVLREIVSRAPYTQVILLADSGSVGSAALGLRDGAFAYLVKPIVDFHQLVHTVERAVELKRLREQVSSQQAGAPLTAPKAGEAALSLALRELIQSACSDRPLAQTSRLLLETSTRLFDAPHAVLLISRPETGLTLDSAWGFEDRITAARDFVRRVGDSFALQVATERGTLMDSTPPADEGEGPCHFVGTPLVVREQLYGVLVVYPIAEGSADLEHIAWLESFAAQGALAIGVNRLAGDNDRLSPIEPVTGTLKRGAFQEIADREFRRSWRFEQPLAVIFLSVDGMYGLRLQKGREVGDLVLRQVAEACRQVTRSIDLVARYEGDALALLLVMTGPEPARAAAERLRSAVHAIDLSDAIGVKRLTASIAVVTYPREGCASIFDLLNLARSGLDTAQRGGVDRVYVV